VKRVFLTKEGRKLVSQNKELDKSVNETTLNGVSESDFETTMRTLEKMKSNLLATLDAAAQEAGGSDAEQRERATPR
jgi:hypothetical protein